MLRDSVRKLQQWTSRSHASAAKIGPTLTQNKSDDVTHPFDVANGLDTSGYVPAGGSAKAHPAERHSSGYYASAPSLVRAMLDRWQRVAAAPIEHYTFIDLGSGKGRVVLLASEYAFQRCVGVEFNPSLHAIAFANAQRWRAQGNAVSPIEMLCEDATAYEFPATPCLIYLFHPFSCETFAQLLDRIEAAFADRSGELDLLYVNAECQHLLERHAGFCRLWQHGVAMSPEDAAADLLYAVDASGQPGYGTAMQEPCSAWRWIGRRPPDRIERR